MKVVLVHNYYQQPGGEDQVFAAEAALLEEHGHQVTRYTVHNDAVADMGRVALAKATVWNGTQYRALRDLFQRVAPDVVHVHNTLPLVSPAVYDAARAEGAAVVQTLHNFRRICPSALLFRDDAPCELCVGKTFAWPGVVHACYRGSRAATAMVATSLAAHRFRGTYARGIDRYVALTEFARERFIAGGLPADRIVVKPNFLATDPGTGDGAGGYALFVGRLSPEKGPRVLQAAWREVGGAMPLRVIGDGPLGDEVAAWAASTDGVSWLGRRSSAEVLEAMKGAALVVVPSTCYEGLPMAIVEAFAVGTPVVASRHGALGSVVDDGRTGRTFDPGDGDSLAAAVRWAVDHPEALGVMRAAAREEYLRRYTAEANYAQLMQIYWEAVARRAERPQS